MSEVPWAPGRKALVMTEWGWRAGFGRKSRGAEPDFWIVPEDGASGATWERRISAEGRATALLPEQCPRCFEVGAHTPGCASPHTVEEILEVVRRAGMAPDSHLAVGALLTAAICYAIGDDKAPEREARGTVLSIRAEVPNV